MRSSLLLGPLLLPSLVHAQSPHILLVGTSPGGEFGSAVSSAGDVDADGYLDIAVGAPFDATGGDGAGALHVFSGLDGSLLLHVTGPAGGNLGHSVAGVGDLDGDGHDDLAVGLPHAGSSKGKTRIYSGATGAMLLSVAGGAQGHYLGWSVAGLGDTNGDGVRDFAVGSPGDGDGSARILSGVDASTLHVLTGGAGTEFFGISMASAGDIDGDGVDDLVVGAPDSGFQPGQVRVFSGATGTLLHLFQGTADHDFVGMTVAGGGDADGDGIADIAYGGRGDGSGLAVVRSGATGAEILSLSGFADHFGNDVDLGDFDGDGLADLLVASYAVKTPDGSPNGGNVRVHSTRDGSVLFSVNDSRASSWFGWSASFLGDLQGDGLIDLVAGAPQFGTGGVGKAVVHRGRMNLGSSFCSPAAANSTGKPGSMVVQGSAVVAEGWVNLLAVDLPPSKPGFFLVGSSQTFLPNPGGSQGTLCVDGARVFLPDQATSQAWGALGLSLDLTDLPGGMSIQPGDTWYFQAWHLDVNPSKTSNLTDAVSVTFQ